MSSKQLANTHLTIYDYLFITHLPSFYKVNLYNQLAKRLRIFVVFIASSSVIRTDDFTSREFDFEHVILHEGDFESRNRIDSIARLLKIISRVNFRKVVVGGWDLPEFWVTVLVTTRARNGLALESSISESSTVGLRSMAKRFFLSRISLALPSGTLHRDLLDALDYKGEVRQTGGVGIFNRPTYDKVSKVFSCSFLYVGRLSQEKNLRLLVTVFNRLPRLTLTIVGSGPIESELKNIARGNISFRAHVPNADIANAYLSHDVFILPSLSEPWGLVVDEALYYGLPVIVSSRVGCHTELVAEGRTGFVFDPCDGEALSDSVRRISQPDVYTEMRKNVALMDFSKRDESQIRVYVDACT